MKIPQGMTLFLGAPGSGKTTLASYFCHKFMKQKKNKNKNCFSNVPILGALQLNCNEDLGKYLVEDGMVVIDEGGIEYNNRAYKLLPKTTIQFAKLYRHYGIKHFLFFSQGMDIDITFVRLCDRVCLVRKSYIPYFIFIREVKKVVGIDEISKQLVDQYEMKPFGWHWVFMPLAWRYFDTYETPFLPSKKFLVWDNKTRFVMPSEPILASTDGNTRASDSEGKAIASQ